MKPSRLALLGVGLAVFWLVAYFIVLPAVVSDAYAGRSFLPLLNRAISGQSQHPVDHYVSLARRAVLLATVAGIGLACLAFAAWRWRDPIRASAHRVLRAQPVIGPVDVLLVGAWIGLLGGALEVAGEYLRFSTDPDEVPTRQMFWMAPLGAGLFGMMVGAVLAVVVRARKGLSVVVPVAVIAAAEAYAVVSVLQLGIHRVAIAILSLGIAVQLGRLAAKSPVFPRMVRRSTPWLMGAVVATFTAVAAKDYWRALSGERLRGAAEAGSPNVLILLLDTVRREDLSLYGYSRRTSPELERLAARGVTFDRAIAPAPWTLPSHAAMFTGRPPDQLTADFDVRLDGSTPTLAEVLRARGYATGGFVANLEFTTRGSGLDRGFTVYEDFADSPALFINSSYWLRRMASRIRSRGGNREALVRKYADDVNREFLEWVPENGTPFFAFLNYIDAHTPYRLAAPFDTLFQNPPPTTWLGWSRDHTDRELAEIRTAYNSAIAYVDASIGDLLRELEQRGILKNTLVIVTSDHGELFGEHGGVVLHANSLYMPVLRVPLVMSLPGRLPSDMEVDDVVSIQQIPATILDVLGEASPELPGRSLVPAWEDPAHPDTAMIFSDLTYFELAHPEDPIADGYMQSLVQGRLHYIRNGDGTEELYDYVRDEDELLNLAQDSAALLEPFRKHLRDRAALAVPRANIGRKRER